jgi:hypothetical protein
MRSEVTLLDLGSGELWGTAYCLHSHAQSGSRYRLSPIDQITLITWGEYAVCNATRTKLRVCGEVCGPSCVEATGERCRYAKNLYDFFFLLYFRGFPLIPSTLPQCKAFVPGGLGIGARAPDPALNSLPNEIFFL